MFGEQARDALTRQSKRLKSHEQPSSDNRAPVPRALKQRIIHVAYYLCCLSAKEVDRNSFARILKSLLCAYNDSMSEVEWSITATNCYLKALADLIVVGRIDSYRHWGQDHFHNGHLLLQSPDSIQDGCCPACQYDATGTIGLVRVCLIPLANSSNTPRPQRP
jgi:hypothetical protein